MLPYIGILRAGIGVYLVGPGWNAECIRLVTEPGIFKVTQSGRSSSINTPNVVAVPRSSVQSACEFLTLLHQLLRIVQACQLLESPVRPALVVVGSPSIDHGAGFSQIIEPVSVQALVV